MIISVDFVKTKFYLIKFVISVTTEKYRGPSHNASNTNVKQKDSNFIPFAFHNFSKYACQMFCKKIVNIKNYKVKIKYIPKRIEEYISVTYGCIKFIDSYRFLSESLDNYLKI